ncbi:MAG TPA: efflux RND transporter periplasmic adaptor subunit [Caldilineaceae bacterium]|nr:efflux RND transporter periplasmic adaptor subunit [Caldilineaceae bacterium]
MPAVRLGIVLAAVLSLAACDLARSQPTPAPFTPPTYDAGSAATPATATPAASAAQGAAAPLPILGNRTDAAGGLPLYTGEVLPEESVPVIVEVGGQVIELNMEVGQRVNAGDILLRIESSTLEAQRAQALAGLEAAQAQLELLQAEPDEADIEAARAAVAAADAAYKRALEGPTAEELTVAESQLRQAEAAVKRAQAAYDQVAWNPVISALPESLQLEQATLALEAAQAQYDRLVQGATADVIAGAYAQVASARAQLRRLEEGAEPAQIQAAAAQVRQAETALYLAQLQLDKATVRAPITGIISQVNIAVGAMAAPGNPVAILLSPAVKVVIPVEESNMAALWVGQPARIRVNAYPDRTFAGEVAIIAPELDPATRTVRVTIRPTGDAAGLAPGMFATVELLDE